MKTDMVRELDREVKSGRLLLERLPADKLDWRPHPDIRSVAELAWHMASLPGVVTTAIQEEQRDRTQIVWPPRPASVSEMTTGFDQSVALAKANLDKMGESDLAKPFRMLFGDKELFAMTRGEFLRWGMMTHFVHHRAQVGLYLRMLNVEVPAMVGPSKDDMTFLR